MASNSTKQSTLAYCQSCSFLWSTTASPPMTNTINTGRYVTKRHSRTARMCETSQYSPNSREEVARSHPLSQRYPSRREIALTDLPAHHYINLTNGVEAIIDLDMMLSDTQIRFTRIQSSHCESGAYEKILTYLDNDLLFSLACGRDVFVYDFASRNKSRGVPRSIFLGIQFIKWSLAYLWFGKNAPELVPDVAFVRGKNTVPYWRDEIMRHRIEKDLKRKIRYFAPYAREMGVTAIKLHGVYGRATSIDGCLMVHVKMVRAWLEKKESLTGLDCHELSTGKYALFDSALTDEELVKIQGSLSEPTTKW